MHLLVCVLDREDHLDAVLSGFVDLGVTGATLIKSEGMGRVLTDLPVFAGLQSLLAQARPQNTTVLSVIKDPAMLEAVVDHVRAVCDDLEEPGTGILFTIALDQVVGLSPRQLKAWSPSSRRLIDSFFEALSVEVVARWMDRGLVRHMCGAVSTAMMLDAVPAEERKVMEPALSEIEVTLLAEAAVATAT